MDLLDAVTDLCLLHMLVTEQSVFLSLSFFNASNFHIRGALRTVELQTPKWSTLQEEQPDHGGGCWCLLNDS